MFIPHWNWLALAGRWIWRSICTFLAPCPPLRFHSPWTDIIKSQRFGKIVEVCLCLHGIQGSVGYTTVCLQAPKSKHSSLEELQMFLIKDYSFLSAVVWRPLIHGYFWKWWIFTEDICMGRSRTVGCSHAIPSSHGDNIKKSQGKLLLQWCW